MSRYKIDTAIISAVEDSPRALHDDIFLTSLVYERLLGKAQSDIYSLKYCLREFHALKLPEPKLVIARKKILIKQGAIKIESTNISENNGEAESPK